MFRITQRNSVPGISGIRCPHCVNTVFLSYVFFVLFVILFFRLSKDKVREIMYNRFVKEAQW